MLARFPRRPSLTLVGVVALVVAIANPAAAPPTDLDPTFDGDGKVTTDFAGNSVAARGVATQGDGKIVIAGSTDVSGTDDFVLARYNTDGSLDTAFDGDGRVTTNFGPAVFPDRAFAVTIQGDGKILAAGRAAISNFDFGLARYNTDGSLDTTFDGDGLVTTDFAGGTDEAFGVAIQGDGKIVAAGHAIVSGTDDFVLARYNTDGSRDTTFDGDGKVTTDFAGGDDEALELAVQGDGKIVAAGCTACISSASDFGLARYNTDGSRDTTFDGDGKVTTDFAANIDQASGVAIQADGKVVAAGQGAAVSGNADFGLARYNTDGSLDTTFDGDGKVTTSFGASEQAHGVALQGDGKIVAAGTASPSGSADFALARYNANGSLDAAFSGDGKVTTDFAGGNDDPLGVAIQGDGKIVAAGGAFLSGNFDFALAPYVGQGSADLALTKAGPPGRAPTGRNMTYTLTVTNNGPDDASGVTVTDQLPPSVTFVSATPSQGSCGEAGGIVTCNLGTMGNGVTATVNIVVKPTVAGTITNTASVTAFDQDPNQGNNSDSENTSVCRITSRRSSIPCGSAPPTTFSFAAAGDHGANSRTDASLAALNTSGASFYLALGDLDYDETPTDEAWCDYVKARLPNLGPSFPFQLVSGNHEEQGGVDGYILNHAACLPDRLGSTIGPNSQYGAEYYFDYPAGAPLARVIMLPAHLMVENVHYDYAPGSSHRQWLVDAIDEARASGVRWVVVGMHHQCLTAGEKLCSMSDLMNLLIEKKVDLILQAHDHNYQRSKQLAHDPSTCPSVPINAYDPDCVVDDGADGAYPKGAGTVTVIDGTFGRGLYTINPSDPEAPYFVRTDSTTWGFTEYTVTPDRIDARFVNSVGSFTDAFSIVSGGTPEVDSSPPTPPSGLTATPSSGTRIDLSWTASTDNAGVDRYSIFRGGAHLATTTTTSYSDTSVIPGGTYAYSVTAYDTSGNPSPPSETVTVTTPAQMTTLTFGPAADTYILAATPTGNFGSASSLQVDNSPIEQTLMKFSVSGIGTRTVATAKLRLYNVNESSAGGTFYRVADNSWGESTINWNTAPAAASIPFASLGAVATNTWYEIDLSSVVTGDGSYSFRITSTSSNGADYTSKEGAVSFRPQLVVTLQP